MLRKTSSLLNTIIHTVKHFTGIVGHLASKVATSEVIAFFNLSVERITSELHKEEAILIF